MVVLLQDHNLDSNRHFRFVVLPQDHNVESVRQAQLEETRREYENFTSGGTMYDDDPEGTRRDRADARHDRRDRSRSRGRR